MEYIVTEDIKETVPYPAIIRCKEWSLPIYNTYFYTN